MEDAEGTLRHSCSASVRAQTQAYREAVIVAASLDGIEFTTTQLRRALPASLNPTWPLRRLVSDDGSTILRRASRTVEVDESIAALRLLVEHRDDLARTRTQLVNRLHTPLVKLVPSELPRGLNAEHAAEALRRVRPRDTLGRTLRALAVELVAELRSTDASPTSPPV